jgi:Flp pilus assembly protein TadG
VTIVSRWWLQRSGMAKRRAGQAMVEVALVLPVILLLLLGMIDFGRAFMLGVAAQNAAREAARLGANAFLDETITDSIIEQRLINGAAPAMPGLSATTCALRSNCTDSSGVAWQLTITFAPARTGSPLKPPSGARVEVTAVGSVPLLTGFLTGMFGINQISVQGNASMAVF